MSEYCFTIPSCDVYDSVCWSIETKVYLVENFAKEMEKFSFMKI
jgi:hypothetical protein